MDVNFLHKPKIPDEGPSLRGFFLLLLITVGVLMLIGGIVLTTRNKGKEKTSFLGILQRLIVSSDIPLEGEKGDRLNVLLLGIGGEGHDGGFLSDTILLASIKPSTGTIALISFPRDLAVPFTNGEWRKVNAVSAFAEQQEEGSGGDAIRNALATLLDLPIPYYVRVDFSGFTQLIDALGGVTIIVENRIDDPRYPIPGNEGVYPVELRYEHLVFDPGTYTMDGTTALKYVRSRRGIGIEGSDFARTKRQQNLLLAVYKKILSWPTLTNPSRIRRIIDELTDHVRSNMAFGEGLRLARILRSITASDIKRITLSDAPESVLAARIVNGAYILEPRDGSFATIRTLVHNAFTTPPETLPEATTTPKESATVAILNGTTIPGLARTIGDILEQQGFTVAHIANATQRSLARTMIYDTTNGEKYLAYDRLRLLLDAIPQTDIHALSAQGTPLPKTDFVILLGANARIPAP